MLPWFVAFLVGLVVLLILIITVGLLHRVVRVGKAKFYCPWTRRETTIRYLTHDGRHPVGVVSCTALADPRTITCGERCVSKGEGIWEVAEDGKAELVAD